MRGTFRIATLLLLACALSACVSLPAPTYQPSLENNAALTQAGGEKLGTGSFTAADGVKNHKLSMRGSTLKGGSDGTYSTYLREALISDLQSAGRYDPDSGIRIGATLTRNDLNAANIRIGKAQLGARFVVERDGTMVYDKVLEIEHQWDSSFMGAVAIPAAINNYSAAVQKLLHALLTDPDFTKAIQP